MTTTLLLVIINKSLSLACCLRNNVLLNILRLMRDGKGMASKLCLHGLLETVGRDLDESRTFLIDFAKIPTEYFWQAIHFIKFYRLWVLPLKSLQI